MLIVTQFAVTGTGTGMENHDEYWLFDSYLKIAAVPFIQIISATTTTAMILLVCRCKPQWDYL